MSVCLYRVNDSCAKHRVHIASSFKKKYFLKTDFFHCGITMIWKVAAILLQLHLYHVSAEVKTSSFARGFSVEDFLYTNNLLFEAYGWTKIRCAGMCGRKDGCMTFTFSPSTSLQPSTCRGHSIVVTSADPRQSSPGTKVYRIAGRPSVVFSICCSC